MEDKRLPNGGWEALFRTFFDHASEALFLHDAVGQIIDVNRHACQSLGYTREELIGRSLRDIDASLDEAFMRRMAARLDAGETVTFETMHRRKDGSELPVQVRVCSAEQAGPRFRLLFARDLSERKRAERALQDSEERFRTLVQVSFDVYWETDAQHRFTRQEFSQALADAPARESEIGKTRWEVPYVEPDEDAWRAHRATLEAHLPFRDFELARPKPDGGRRYVSVSGYPVFDETGRFVGYRGVGRHVTERKRAEAEHRAYLWFLESMDRINRAIQGTNDLEKMMSEVLDAVLEVFACDRAWLLYPCDPDAPSWRVVMEHTRPQFPGAFALGRDLPMTADLAEVAQAALASRVSMPAGPHHERQVQPLVAERFGVLSEMLMALHPKGDQPYLFGLHQCARQRSWTKEEQRLFEEIGHRLTDALSGLIAFRSLQESERRLEAAQHIAQVGWWERDFLTGRVSLSDESIRIFGVQPVDLPHWHGRWLTLMHPEDRPKAAAASEAALRGGPRYDVEYRVVRPDGNVRVVHSQGEVTRDESGRPLRQFGVMQDITDLRQAEQDLRSSEARFRTFVDRATDAFFLLDEQLNVVDVNRQACEGLGRSREELIGMHPRDFDVSLDEPSIRKLAERAGAGETITFETRHRRKDGHAFPVEIRTGTFRQGGSLFYLALARDITERRQAEHDLRATAAALRESEQRYRTLFEKANDAIFLENERDEILEVNEQACALLGYSRAQLLRMKVPDLQAPEVRGEAGWAIRDELDKHGNATFEAFDLHRSGRRIPVEVTNTAISDRGEKLVLSIVRDITERKSAEEELRASEARFRTFVDHATDAFFLLDEQLRLVDVNHQACDSLGYSREELIGMHPRTFDVGLDETAIGGLAARVAGGEMVTFETLHRRKDGVVFPVEIRARQFGQGDKRFHLSLARDISERKLVEETLRGKDHALQMARTQLAHVSRLTTLGELTASIAHEVSQPLGAMMTSAAAGARWLTAAPPDIAEARAALGNIVADGKRAREVIGRIRALAKRQALRKHWLDINQEILEVLALTEHELRTNEVVLRTHLDSTLPQVAADHVQLQQVLLNLIVNAIEAMSVVHDRPRDLTIASVQDGTNAVMVEVRDSGKGLGADSAERVFESFYTTKPEGLGIGLSISRSIVEAHGGRLWAAANEPHGALFWFSLPVAGEEQL